MKAILMIRNFVFALTLFMVAPAHAGAITQEGTEALKPKIEAMLISMTAALEQSGLKLKSEGQVLVEGGDGYYAITTPALSLVMPDGVTRNIGMVAINAIPTSDPEVFKVAIALPTPMTDKNEAGQDIGSLTLGRQAMSGIWNMQSLAFTEVKARYADIHFIDMPRSLDVKMETLDVNFQRTESHQKTWSGPFDVAITGLEYTDKKNTYQSIMPKRIAALGTLKNMPFEAFLPLNVESFKKAINDAGTNINITKLDAEGDNFSATIAGEIQASSKNKFGVKGATKLSTRGLENVLAALSTPPAQGAQPVIDPTLMATLAVVQLTGVPGTDPQGRPTKNFDLNISSDGKLTLNGADLTALVSTK